MKIFDKKSASPTMIFRVEPDEHIFGDIPVVIKLWVKPCKKLVEMLYKIEEEKKTEDIEEAIADWKDAVNGMDYEKYVYEYLALQNPDKVNWFVMQAVGGGLVKFPMLLDYMKDKNRRLLSGALFIYITNLLASSTSYANSIKLYNEMKDDVERVINRYDYELIILPAIDGCTFADVIDVDNEQDVAVEFGKILLGVFNLYKHGIIHNDLHSSNILIHDKHLFIFDFDRSYIDGTPNKFLNTDPRVYPCVFSQCNIYNKTHVIDFYKILSYLIRSKHFNVILGLLVPPQNFRATQNSRTIYFMYKDPLKGEIPIWIHELLEKAQMTFFANDLGSYLQYLDNNPTFKHFVELMGPFDDILRRYEQNLRILRDGGRAEFGFTKNVRKGVQLDRIDYSKESRSNKKDIQEVVWDLEELLYNVKLQGAYKKVPFPVLMERAKKFSPHKL